jgi:hypothetical protein
LDELAGDFASASSKLREIHTLLEHETRAQALETKKDTEGACAAYKVVLDRWGHAKPRSVTADQARERAKALGCVK